MLSGVNPTLHNRKVFVGLSGGVDSAVSAALLKQAGAQVTGVFIKGWYPPGLRCTWAEDRRDAMRVAAHLELPFVTLDASQEYKRGVIDYLLAEYRAGRTPNPDIMCNREVKFGAFYRFALEQGADYIATGHYAQIDHSGDAVRLVRGVDPEKDQSYFLWAIPHEALSRTLFPVGGMPKAEVRSRARSFNLPVASKKDSQGICFLGSISVEEFLESEFGTEAGDAVDESGAHIGTHNGVLLHTLGERISLAHAAPGPWYVVAKDIAQNILVVSTTRASAQHTSHVNIQSQNWFSLPEASERVLAQYRYHGPKIPGHMPSAGTFAPDAPLAEPIASGQSLVIYRNEECLGGGIIA